MPEERGTLRTDGLEDCADVVHPLLERRQPVVRDTVGQPSATLVEQDEPREGCETLEEVRHRRLLPHHLDVRHPTRHVDEIARAIPDDLVRDVQVAAAGVLRLWRHDDGG